MGAACSLLATVGSRSGSGGMQAAGGRGRSSSGSVGPMPVPWVWNQQGPRAGWQKHGAQVRGSAGPAWLHCIGLHCPGTRMQFPILHPNHAPPGGSPTQWSQWPSPAHCYMQARLGSPLSLPLQPSSKTCTAGLIMQGSPQQHGT